MATLSTKLFFGILTEKGDHLRIVYMDEAGVSLESQEPYLIVAAAITNPDKHWHPLRKFYDDLAENVFEEPRPGFIFHAKDIWHGTKDFPRDKFDRTKRFEIIRILGDAPTRFDIPICFGIIEKSKFPAKAGQSSADRTAIMHGLAYHVALQSADWWMETNSAGEVAMIVAEDVDQAKIALKLFHDGAQVQDGDIVYDHPGIFQSRCIVDTVNFVSKQGSPNLQIADHMAFIFRRAIAKCEVCSGIYYRIHERVVIPNSRSRGVRLRVPSDELRRLEIAILDMGEIDNRRR